MAYLDKNGLNYYSQKVSEKIQDVKDDLDELKIIHYEEQEIEPTIINGKRIATTAAIANDQNYAYATYEVESGEIYHIKGSSNRIIVPAVIIFSNTDIYKSQMQINVDLIISSYGQSSQNSVFNAYEDTITMPQNAKLLLVQSYQPTINPISIKKVNIEKVDRLADANFVQKNYVDNQVNNLQTELSTKANSADLATVATSGSYNDLSNKPTIPTAISELTNDSNFTNKSYVDNLEKERLASLEFTEDNTPYLFRKSGGNGNEEPVIVGVTVKYNQLVYDGNFSETPTSWKAQHVNSTISVVDGIATVTVVSGDISPFNPALSVFQQMPQKSVEGHKYLAMMDIKPPCNCSTYLQSGATSMGYYALSANVWNRVEYIKNVTVGNKEFIGYIGINGAGNVLQLGDSISYKNISCYDLTAMFGSTIADYVYSLEQTTSGSGIAWLRKYGYFTKDYYPYSEPTFKHIEGLVSHKMVGFNQWDEVWEAGGISNTTGDTNTDSNRFRSKNFIPLLPDTTYYAQVGGLVSNDFRMFFYDANKDFIGTAPWQYSGTFTTPANAHFGKFVRPNKTTYSNDICINLSDPAKNGTYEPYKEYTYPLGTDVVLRGFPKLDASGNLYYDGDRYLPDGTVQRNWTLIDLGTCSYAVNKNNQGTNIFSTATFASVVGNGICMCTAYVTNSDTARPANMPDKTLSINRSPLYISGNFASGEIIIKDSTYDGYTGAQFAEAMSGQYLLVKLATPTTETADPYQSPQVVDGFGTEEWVFDDNTFPVPVGHETTYRNIVTIQDVKDIQSNIDDIQFDLNNKQDILTFDSTPTANSTNPVTSGGIKTALDNKETAINNVEVSGVSPVIVAESNTIYSCGEVTSLSFTPCASGICDVRFTSGSTVTVLTIPNTVKFPNSFDPTSLETNTVYEINILDGVYGVVMSWAV